MDPGRSVGTAHGPWKDGKRQDRRSVHSLPCAPSREQSPLDLASCNVDGTTLLRLFWFGCRTHGDLGSDETREVMESPDLALVLPMTLLQLLFSSIPPSRLVVSNLACIWSTESIGTSMVLRLAHHRPDGVHGC